MLIELPQSAGLRLYINNEAGLWELSDVEKLTDDLTGDVFPNLEIVTRDDTDGKLHRYYGYIENLAEDAIDNEYDVEYLIERAGKEFASHAHDTFLEARLTTNEIPLQGGLCDPAHLLIQPGVYLANEEWLQPPSGCELLRVTWDTGVTWFFPIIFQFPVHPAFSHEMPEYATVCRLLRGATYAEDTMTRGIHYLMEEGILDDPEHSSQFTVGITRPIN